MTNNIISIDNVVNVSVTRVARGLAVKDINSCCIFSQDALAEGASFTGNFASYYDATSVANDFGSSSQTYQLANAFFSQTPNPISTNSPLKIYRFTGVSATGKSITTIDLSDNIANFDAVNAGSLEVNGEQITDLDFSGATSIEQIANIIRAELPNNINLSVEGNALVFETVSVGSDAELTLGAGTSGTDLSGDNFLKLSSASTIDGSNVSGTTLIECIQQAQNEIDFVGVLTTQEMDADAIISTANAIQSLDMIWILPVTDTTLATAAQLGTSLLTHTRGLYHDDFESALLFSAAYMGRAFSVNFAGSDTVQDMFLKELVGINAAQLTQNTLETVLNSSCDTYVNFGGISRVYTSLINSSFDGVYNLMALKFYLQNAVFNLLATNETKIPQTEAGMDGIKSVIRGILDMFVRNGFCAAGKWNSSTTFGNPVVFRKNIAQVGYYIYSLPISQQLQSEREQRIAPLIQVAVKEAGSINHVMVNVFVEA